MTTPGANNNGIGVDAARQAAAAAAQKEQEGGFEGKKTTKGKGARARAALKSAGRPVSIAYKHTIGKGVKMAKAGHAAVKAKKNEKKVIRTERGKIHGKGISADEWRQKIGEMKYSAIKEKMGINRINEGTDLSETHSAFEAYRHIEGEAQEKLKNPEKFSEADLLKLEVMFEDALNKALASKES